MGRNGGGRLLARDDGLRAAYLAHGGELYRFALRSLGDAGRAEEAVQETFVRAWRAADRFDESLGSLRTWLFAISRNVVIDLSRARAARPPLAPAVDDEPPDGGQSVEEAALAWLVEEALRRLSSEHRDAVVEVHYRGRTYEEAGRALSVPPGTVKSRVYYGLRALRLVLEELGWPDDG